MQPQHFHAILQGSRNRVEHVRCSYEEDLREIVFDVEIMVLEHEVLFRIEHFQQCG